MTDRLKHGTKYPKVDKLPKGAALLSTYKDIIGVKNAANLEDLSKESILILLRLNLRHRVINFHQFGIDINYSKLI